MEVGGVRPDRGRERGGSRRGPSGAGCVGRRRVGAGRKRVTLGAGRRVRGQEAGVGRVGVCGVAENGPVSDVRHVLVLPDRDAAEEVVEELRERFGVVEEPLVVRDALAGEDDAEDAQWLVVLGDEAGRLGAEELDAFAREWEGWREEP